jgi:hypothetical protein
LVPIRQHCRFGEGAEEEGNQVKPETEATLARIARRHAERYHSTSNSQNAYSRPLFEKAMDNMFLDAYRVGRVVLFKGGKLAGIERIFDFEPDALAAAKEQAAALRLPVYLVDWRERNPTHDDDGVYLESQCIKDAVGVCRERVFEMPGIPPGAVIA